MCVCVGGGATVLLTPLANLDVPLGWCLLLAFMPRHLMWIEPFSSINFLKPLL
jgi:hypothetical protein